jgi:hypothetical protein
MKMRILTLALLLALTGCGLPTNLVVLLPDENGGVGKVAVHEGAAPSTSTNRLPQSTRDLRHRSATSSQLRSLTSTANLPALSKPPRERRLALFSIFRQG